ncbi:hypothetical protein [Aliiglaciecola sp. NS0011-25]|uniref:hypothetical protein n=1 Tax=Aliiglaciecola sp. NS0011-25 TaxID=3127654 RepID=UPI00310C34F3
MNLSDIISINAHINDAAIVLDKGISNSSLVGSFMPTKASIKVFEHLSKAVSPSATQEQRAINVYGSYGSGKSHLAVVIAHLLKFGADGEGFEQLLSKISSSKNENLAKNIKNTFLSDADARPYLFVSLYGSNTTSIGAKLLQGLYDALDREAGLEPSNILPKTEFDACRERLQSVIELKPEILNQDLDEFGISEYLDIESLLVGLENHENQAVKAFLEWHKKETFGMDFNIAVHGGRSFVHAYKEAGASLYKNHNYAGIVVLWDEFGHAIEDLISSPYRNSGEEIMQLQEFVETTCSPSYGHTIFIGVTHVSFEEYGDRTKADNVVKDGLAKISGRFNTPFRIELSASENEGYHLLDMQKSWTQLGTEVANNSKVKEKALIDSCFNLSMFESLRDELGQIIYNVYPLHPALASGLFNLAQIAAQANRTALTFFRDNSDDILDIEVLDETIWGDELIRLPKIVDFYDEKFQALDSKVFQMYQKSLSKIGGTKVEIERRKDILKLILLSSFLGENFQITENFLSAVLYDCDSKSHKATTLFTDLEWLKSANLVWKNVATEHWQLTGESGISVDDIVSEEIDAYDNLTLSELIEYNPKIKDEFFPMLGVGNFEPKPDSGIIRSYSVRMRTDILSQFKDDPAISIIVNMVPVNNGFEADELVAKVKAADPTHEVYYWIPKNGFEDVCLEVENVEKNLLELMKEYLAINKILVNSTLIDSVKSQLIGKRQLVNRSIKLLVSKLFGKEGLSANETLLIKSGSTSPILNLKNWNDIKQHLEAHCHSLYPKDIPVRYMKMNFLYKNKDIGNVHPNAPLIANVVDKILDYSSHPAYHTRFLGEKSETSPVSGVINGVLGEYANNIFIERPDDLDLKGADEVSENLKEILTFIKKKILKRRDKPFEVMTLEEELNAAPYGLPSCVLPILIALSIRNDSTRVSFLHKEKTVGSAFARCFMNQKPLRSRMVEFTSKQVSVLSLYGQVLREIGVQGGEQRSNYLAEQSLAESYVKEMKNWFKYLSEATITSKLLSEKAKSISKTFTTIGATNQDIADATVNILELTGSFSYDKLDTYIDSLSSIFREFAQIEDLKKQLLLDAWTKNLPEDDDKILKVRAYLNNFNDDFSQGLVLLLDKARDSELVTPEQLVELKYSKRLDACTDMQIQTLCNEVEFSIKNGLSYQPTPLIPGNNQSVFCEKVIQLIENFKLEQYRYLLGVITFLDEKKGVIASELLKSIKDGDTLDLDLIVKDATGKAIEEIDETEREKVRDSIVKLLDTALYSAIRKEKLKTNDGLRLEFKRILKLSSMSTVEKVELLNELLNDLSSDERVI